jgi:hypothetical protein
VPEPLHGLDQVADPRRLRAREVPQIVDAHTVAADLGQCRREVVAEHLVVEMTPATRWREQRCLSVVRDMVGQVPLQVVADMRRHHDRSPPAALGGVDAAALAMGESTTNRDHFATLPDVFASQFANLAESQSARRPRWA